MEVLSGEQKILKIARSNEDRCRMIFGGSIHAYPRKEGPTHVPGVARGIEGILLSLQAQITYGMDEQALPVLPDTLEREEIEYTCRMIRGVRTRGELGRRLAGEILGFSMFDLQVIGGTIREEIRRLPSPYREAVGAYFIEQLFGRHHQLITQFWNGEFEHLVSPIADRDLFVRFCDMIPNGCFSFTSNSETCLTLNRPRYRFFYYLIACYTMFVREYPGHPVGMPFPGPFFVEEKNGIYLCPIRDKEKDVFYSICNFCPARQSELPR